MKVLLPFVCVVLFVAFTTADIVGDSANGTELSLDRHRRCPTIRFPCSRMRSVCANIARAIKGGEPKRLHRITNRRAINNNARLSKCYKWRRRRQGCARYPFATTKEGGRGAFRKNVPFKEVKRQRDLLYRFYKNHRIGNGGCFKVKLAKAAEPSCPTITFPCSRMRRVCANIRRAIKGGKPTRLHRITNRRDINNNARLAKCAGRKCAQYPFAMTREGGKGAFVKRVPRDEIRLQRSLLVRFYMRKKIGNRNCFKVKLRK